MEKMALPFALIPFLLLTIPILEIVVFILIGGQIGLWPTLGFILLTAVLGSILLRWQGLNTMRSLQNDLAANRLPAKALGEGAMLIVAGILLLTPGFVTDSLGFLLFIPQIRAGIFSFLSQRVHVMGANAASSSNFSFQMGDHPNQSRPETQRNKGSRIVDLDESESESQDPDERAPWHDKQSDK